jgi:hypothetical protein
MRAARVFQLTESASMGSHSGQRQTQCERRRREALSRVISVEAGTAGFLMGNVMEDRENMGDDRTRQYDHDQRGAKVSRKKTGAIQQNSILVTLYLHSV